MIKNNSSKIKNQNHHTFHTQILKKLHYIIKKVKKINKPEIFEIEVDDNIIGFVLFNLKNHNAMYDFCKNNFKSIMYFF